MISKPLKLSDKMRITVNSRDVSFWVLYKENAPCKVIVDVHLIISIMRISKCKEKSRAKRYSSFFAPFKVIFVLI